MIENLIFMSCQPNEFKYIWELEIQITNFRKFDISKQMHILVWYQKGEDLKNWAYLKSKYPEVNIFLYEDQGADRTYYEPIIRPHALKQHFKQHESELKGKSIFYHDSDIIFSYLPDFQSLMNHSIVWESDTSGYLDYDYLRRVEDMGKIPANEVIDKLAEIGGITTDIIKLYRGKTGGAQYLFKNIDSEFWQDVEDTTIKIRNYLYFGSGGVNSKYFPHENAGFQSWCADMWAVNFCLWKRGIPTDVTNQLAFSWATDRAEEFTKKPIFHNAGATHLSKGLFWKAGWKNTSPIDKNISVSKNFCSWYYVEAMKEVK